MRSLIQQRSLLPQFYRTALGMDAKWFFVWPTSHRIIC